MKPAVSFFLPSRVQNPSEWPSASSPLLIISNTPVELITSAVTFPQHSSVHGRHVLIICHRRNALLESLTSTLLTSPLSTLNSAPSILASNAVTVYYVETLAHLRVLLSSLQQSDVAFLGIDNFISLHETAAELSAQGISRTLAAMVNITSSSNGILTLRESRESVERSVPILNSGVSGGISQAMIPIIRVLGCWVRGFWSQETNVEGECSAEWTCRGEKWHIRWMLHDGEIDDVQISIR